MKSTNMSACDFWFQRSTFRAVGFHFSCQERVVKQPELHTTYSASILEEHDAACFCECVCKHECVSMYVLYVKS